MTDKVRTSKKASTTSANATFIPPPRLAKLKFCRAPAKNADGAMSLKVLDSKLNQRLLQRITWRKELSEEIKYWRMWFETKGDEWPDDYDKRLNPNTEFDLKLREFIKLPEDKEIKFLDVGSGPVTGVGFVWPGRKLKITAVDPLADMYNSIIDEFALTAPVRSKKCPAEQLSAMFANERFDLVHCRNALDHSYDPFTAIKQMLAVTKPGGAVVLDHYANEAVHHSYTGLHQWNFDQQDGRFILWNRSGKIDIAGELGASVEVECFSRQQGRTWILAVLRRKSEEKK